MEEKTMKAILKGLAAYFGVDLKATRKKYGQFLHCAISVPLPLSGDVILVPVKMRLPRYENDGATGYINLEDVEKVEEKEDGGEREKCRLYLKGGHSLPVYTSAKIIRQRLHYGRMAQGHYRNLRQIINDDQALLKAMENRSKGRWSRLNNELVLFFLRDDDGDDEESMH